MRIPFNPDAAGKWRETTVAIKLLTPGLLITDELAPMPDLSAAADMEDMHDLVLGSKQAPDVNAALLEELHKEAGLMASLRHPNVVM